MHTGSSAYSDVSGGSTLRQSQGGGTDHAVIGAELSCGVTANTGAGVLQRSVGETIQQVSDVHHHITQSNTILTAESQGAFQHRVLHQNADISHINGLIDILQTQEVTQICTGSVTHVVDVELPLQIEIKGCKGHHVLDFGDAALERSAIGGQEPITLHANAHRLTVLHFLGLDRYHTADGSFHQTHGLVELCLLFLGQLLLDHALNHQVGIHQIFADDDVQRTTICSPALTQAGNDVGNDELQNSGAHSCGHDIAICDGVAGCFQIIAVHSCDILNQNILMTAGEHIADGIAFILLQMLHYGRRDVDKGDAIAGLT